MPEANKRLDQLTTTRFIAALSVVFYHGDRHWGFLGLFPMLTSGPTAVGYFFLLSGFVMSLAYYRPGVRFDFQNYWLARFARIYPVYILSFILICGYYLDILSKIKTGKVLANIFLYQAWIPLYSTSFNIAAWSLSVEVFFYVIFPFLLLWVMRRPANQLTWIALGFWFVSQVVHLVLSIYLANTTKEFLAYFPVFHLNMFLLGMAGGVQYLTNFSHREVKQSSNRILFLVSLGAILFMLSLREFIPGFPKYLSLDTGLLAPFFMVIVLTLAMDTTRLAQTLSHPTLVLLGDASYALYILHIPVRLLLERFIEVTGLTIAHTALFPIYLLVLIILCVLVYKYVEYPARNWLRSNPHLLSFMLLDIVLILAMTRLGFLLRFGNEMDGFARTQRLILRVGPVVFFLFLLGFRFYTTAAWRSLGLAVFSGTILLAGFMYYAWTSGWVEGFPQSIVILIPVLVFGSILLSRHLVHYLTTKFSRTIETT